MTLYITSGPSGSGKTTFYEVNKEKLGNPVLVCPDDIRVEVNGDVSDQSNGRRVWEIAYSRMSKALSEGFDVYFSGVFCKKKSIVAAIKKALEYTDDFSVEIIKFKDGYDLPLLKTRVKSDLDNGISRSNTLTEIDGKTVIELQYNNFINLPWDEVVNDCAELGVEVSIINSNLY